MRSAFGAVKGSGSQRQKSHPEMLKADGPLPAPFLSLAKRVGMLGWRPKAAAHRSMRSEISQQLQCPSISQRVRHFPKTMSRQAVAAPWVALCRAFSDVGEKGREGTHGGTHPLSARLSEAVQDYHCGGGSLNVTTLAILPRRRYVDCIRIDADMRLSRSYRRRFLSCPRTRQAPCFRRLHRSGVDRPRRRATLVETARSIAGLSGFAVAPI